MAGAPGREFEQWSGDSPRARPRRAPRGVRAASRAAGAVVLLLLCLIGAQRADAAAPLSWSVASAFDGGGSVSAVSCPSLSLCAAVDGAGNVLTTTAVLPAPQQWLSAHIDALALRSISCPSASLCVAVDGGGQALLSTNPAGGAGAWSAPVPIDAAKAPLLSVACPSTALCLAVDAAGRLLASGSPASPAWAIVASDAGLRAVACATTNACVAVDEGGSVLASERPGEAGSWRGPLRIDSAGPLTAVSCQSAGGCVAVDQVGNALASADPAAARPTWAMTRIDPVGRPLTSVSCASTGLCVALDDQGRALAADNAGTPLPSWQESSADPGGVPVDLACLAAGACVGVDAAGRTFSGSVPAPVASTEPPAEVTESAATLSGTIDPYDALLEPQQCRFEYGTDTSYGHTLACSGLPAPTGGAQQVLAHLSGLSANTTYHVRLLAADALGTGLGADVAFTTPVSSQIALVYPHPSISGTPASGQRLGCRAGTPAGAAATLRYAWLRDLVAIPGATGSVYSVRDIDTGHHLQCEVTATDGGGSATARSAFVTVPVQGVPAAAGETRVGSARYRAGRVLVPVECSPQAQEGCRVSVRVTATETLRGRRIVALASALRRVNATIGFARAHLAAGQSGELAVAIPAAVRRLLGGRRRVSLQVLVSGTVVGVIEASLSRQQLRILAGRGSRRARSAGAVAGGRNDAATRASAAAPRELLAATPYMGWDTYLALGGHYSETGVLRNASEMITLGLRARGYRYVWLDAGWWRGARAGDGQIAVNPSQWPHGMAWLAATLHEAGLRVGVYTDAGRDGCGGAAQGSYGHYQQDVNTFAGWGFDAVKVDFCGGVEEQLRPADAYSAFHAAIQANSAHRPMLLSICNFLQPGQYAEGQPTLGESAFASYAFGPSTGNSWRTSTDVGYPGRVTFSEVLRNMDADAAAPQAAGPGHWNDPDYLGPDQGLSAGQFRSQLSMWSILAAPLMVSADLTRISGASRRALQNTEVIAIDQDPAGVQGRLVASAGSAQVWVRPLSDGSRAVALLNRGANGTAIRTSAAAIGMPAAGSYAVRDVWAHSGSTSSGAILARVGGYSTVLLRVSAR